MLIVNVPGGSVTREQINEQIAKGPLYCDAINNVHLWALMARVAEPIYGTGSITCCCGQAIVSCSLDNR